MCAWCATQVIRVDDNNDLFKEIYQEGDCSKIFLGGRGGVSTAGMVSAFTPSRVMVACKVLPSPENPYDVVGFVTLMKVSAVVALFTQETGIPSVFCLAWGQFWLRRLSTFECPRLYHAEEDHSYSVIRLNLRYLLHRALTGRYNSNTFHIHLY